MATIAVSGSASTSLPAEVGAVQVVVTADDADASVAAARAFELQSQLIREVQSAAADSAVSWFAENVYTRTVSTVQDYEDAVEHRAQVALTVKFTDFDALSRWVSVAAGIPGVSISRVSWELTDEARAAAEKFVRVEAVRDAVVKAGAYASAVDMRRPRLVAVYEPGLRPGAPPASGYVGGVTRSAGAAGDGFQLKPSPIRVTAQITADFQA